MNHTIPVSITGGKLPVDTSVQVHSEDDTAGTVCRIDLHSYCFYHFISVSLLRMCYWMGGSCSQAFFLSMCLFKTTVVKAD